MTRTAVLQAMLMLGLFLGAGSVSIAEEFIARAITVPETKAVFAQVRSRTIVPARARIGGTIQDVRVQEGDGVKTGQIVAVVVDEKIALELEAAEAGLKALQSQLVNARTELERVEQLVNRGSATQSRLDQVKNAIRCRHQPDRRCTGRNGRHRTARQRRRCPGSRQWPRPHGSRDQGLGHLARRGSRQDSERPILPPAGDSGTPFCAAP
ncbi:biotin/lipoyl-binding protein [Roseibium salinum]|nr:biotin/lipoyl-binding protein [Roseibium salinum]